MGQYGRFDKSAGCVGFSAAGGAPGDTVTIATRLKAATPRNTSRGLPWSMMAPKISGATMPPRLKPVVTKPNTLPNEPGGVTSRTIMSREGMMTPEKKPAAAMRRDQRHAAEIDVGDQRDERRDAARPSGGDQRHAGAVRPTSSAAGQHADRREQQDSR